MIKRHTLKHLISNAEQRVQEILSRQEGVVSFDELHFIRDLAQQLLDEVNNMLGDK